MRTDNELVEMIAAQRRGLADLLETLTEAQASTPSLCAQWNVKQVAIHLTVPFHVGMPRLVIKILAAGGNFDKAMNKMVAAESARPIADIARELRDQATNRFTPPGASLTAPLNDVLVHTEDIRRPLGLGTDLAPDRLKAALDGLSSKKYDRFLKRKERLAGLRFKATDIDYASGEGAEVSGPGEAILMALWARPRALDDLAGDGVAVLRSRLAS